MNTAIPDEQAVAVQTAEVAPDWVRERVALTPAMIVEANRRLMPPPPTDMEEANQTLGAMCGHGALAAALSISVADAVRYLQKPGWINVPLMKEGIECAGFRWERVDKPGPYQTGLILVQFTGPWTEPGVPVKVACQHRHWVAARRSFIWDSNMPYIWQTQSEWQEFFRRELAYDECTGFEVWGTLVIQR